MTDGCFEWIKFLEEKEGDESFNEYLTLANNMQQTEFKPIKIRLIKSGFLFNKAVKTAL